MVVFFLFFFNICTFLIHVGVAVEVKPKLLMCSDLLFYVLLVFFHVLKKLKLFLFDFFLYVWCILW